MDPYLRKNLRIVVMCNLEGVSVIRMKGSARFGTHGLHDGTSAFGGIPRLEGNARLIKVGCKSCIGKRTKKMPEPTKTENGWKSNYVDIIRWNCIADLHRSPIASLTPRRLFVTRSVVKPQ